MQPFTCGLNNLACNLGKADLDRTDNEFEYNWLAKLAESEYDHQDENNTRALLPKLVHNWASSACLVGRCDAKGADVNSWRWTRTTTYRFLLSRLDGPEHRRIQAN